MAQERLLDQWDAVPGNGCGELPIESLERVSKFDRVSTWEVMPALLLLLFSIALSLGMGVVILLVRCTQHKAFSPRGVSPSEASEFSDRSLCFRRPTSWLAIKNRSVLAVQSALGLHNPKPCSWIEGLAGEAELFIAPVINGWILVLGSGLPEPSDDIDNCFRFLLDLSRKLGQVQFFCANRVLQHQAWVKVERGRVLRAYAWAGKTIWQQGAGTAAEKELGLVCFGYAETVERATFGQADVISSNVDKIPLLAARWSLDPGRIEERFLARERGIAGEPSLRY